MSGVKTGRLPRSAFDRPMRESKRKPDFVPNATYAHGANSGWQEQLGEENIRKAMLKICSDAKDTKDARLLLEALGLLKYESKPSVKVFNGQSNEDRYVQPKISEKE